jgi:hypothetical protein
MSKETNSQRQLSRILGDERRLGKEYAFQQSSHRQQILRKEYSHPHFLQAFSWQTEGHMLRYQ